MMLMRAKKDMSPYFRGGLDWNKELALNQGVLSDREAGFNCGKRLRWIEFADPENGERFTFVTTCWSLPPGLLCMLYLMRWRVEKIYDSFKNKLSQTKAWATTGHSRSMQAHFICMAHNLMAIFLAELGRDHGIREEKVLEKRKRWLEKREQQARESGRSMHIFHRLIDSGSQVTVQFVRSLRNAIIHKKPFLDSLPAFRKSMESYLN
jgi:hypothetical protein